MSYITQLSTVISLGGLIFFAGQQTNRIDELFSKVHTQEKQQKTSNELLYDIHGKVCSIEKDIKYIQEKLVKT